MGEVDFAILGIAITLALALGGAIYKTSMLRGTVHREWSKRVDQSIAGLEELALRKLREIYRIIDPWLSSDRKLSEIHRLTEAWFGQDSDSSGREFWPDGPLPDPFSLSDLISGYSRALRFRNRIEKDIACLMRIGPMFVVMLSLGFAAVVLAALDGVGIVDSQVLALIGYIIGACSLIGIVLALGSYVVLLHRLTSIEVLASEAESRA